MLYVTKLTELVLIDIHVCFASYLNDFPCIVSCEFWIKVGVAIPRTFVPHHHHFIKYLNKVYKPYCQKRDITFTLRSRS